MNSKSLFNDRFTLYNNLKRLDRAQFKVFYGALVYYFINYKCFIRPQTFSQLWNVLNYICRAYDKSFPNHCHKELCFFCKAYPYYFIDRIPVDKIATLFARFIDSHIEILIEFAKELYDKDIGAAYTYINEALGLNESVDELVADALGHIRCFS